jgi:hypothetical protein
MVKAPPKPTMAARTPDETGWTIEPAAGDAESGMEAPEAGPPLWRADAMTARVAAPCDRLGRRR